MKIKIEKNEFGKIRVQIDFKNDLVQILREHSKNCFCFPDFSNKENIFNIETLNVTTKIYGNSYSVRHILT